MSGETQTQESGGNAWGESASSWPQQQQETAEVPAGATVYFCGDCGKDVVLREEVAA